MIRLARVSPVLLCCVIGVLLSDWYMSTWKETTTKIVFMVWGGFWVALTEPWWNAPWTSGGRK
jgi:hypothetical protein